MLIIPKGRSSSWGFVWFFIALIKPRVSFSLGFLCSSLFLVHELFQVSILDELVKESLQSLATLSPRDRNTFTVDYAFWGPLLRGRDSWSTIYLWFEQGAYRLVLWRPHWSLAFCPVLKGSAWGPGDWLEGWTLGFSRSFHQESARAYSLPLLTPPNILRFCYKSPNNTCCSCGVICYSPFSVSK